MHSDNKLRSYHYTAIISLVFALVGFSYNAWRLEVSEHNSTLRTASFQLFLELATLEQLVYAAHYDKDQVNGNPRTGWVKIGLINDLSLLNTEQVLSASQSLQATWSEHWQTMATNRVSADAIINAVELARKEVQASLAGLQ